MKVRTVKLLYTLKTENGYIPGGIYSVDSPKGIPKEVLKEIERKRNTVRVLVYDQDDEIKAKKTEKTVLIDDREADVTTEKKRSRRKSE
jgi:hypothetical protein